MHAYLREAAAAGVAILLISEDLDELMTLADRIAVMYEGRIVGEVDAATAAVEEIGLMMAGGRERDMTIRIERRLAQPHWLKVAVPVGSLVVAFLADRDRARRHRPRPRHDLQGLFEAAFTAHGALSQTLIGATPLVFTGLAAAAAFRMNLFNIGGEGQLYFGAIGGLGGGPAPRRSAGGGPDRGDVVAGFAAGAAWALIPGVLRAYLLERTRSSPR